MMRFTIAFLLAAAGAAAAAGPAAAEQSAANRKLAAFRTLCADEGRKVGATRGQDYVTPRKNGQAPMDEFFADYDGNPGSRAQAKEMFAEFLKSDNTAFHRANMGLLACTIYFTEAYEIGIPANVMPGQWARERVDVYKLGPASSRSQQQPERQVPREEPQPANTAHTGVVRTVCAPLITAFVDAWIKDGKTREEAMRYADLIIESFAGKSEDRERILARAGDELKRTDITPSERAEYEVGLCVAVTGTAADAGMIDSGELRSYWEVRKKAIMPEPETSPRVDNCVTLDWGTGKRGDPALLRNSCTYALNVGYCVSQPTAGSPSDSISCEKSKQTSYEIAPKGAALLLMTDGPNVYWRACKPPHKSFLWADENGKSVGACRSY